MNFASLSARDKQILIVGAAIALAALISFVDPAGSWGGIMLISLLAGLGAAYIAVQPQIAPAMKLPATKGLSLLVLGAAATAASAIAALSYINYLFGNLTDIYELIFLVGLVSSIYLLWVGWTAYKAESDASAAPPAAPPATPPAPPAA
jgi:threonine/homoserine/homoserine lactone efflux protein